MAQLPTTVTEQFPFLVTPSGLGLKRSMMLQFPNLRTKGIQFGAYANSINEIKKLKYYSTHIQYLDMLSDKAKGLNAQNILDQVILKPFYPYKSVGF